MEISIPDGRLVDTQGVLVVGDPARVHALACQANAYNYLVEQPGDSPDNEDVQPPSITVRINDESVECGVSVCSISGGRGLLLRIFPQADTDDTYTLHAHEGLPGEPWKVASKMLVLPADEPDAWGEGDAAASQRSGRELIYAGLVLVNGWWFE